MRTLHISGKATDKFGKTIDGGTSWNIIGDVAFQSTDKWFRDLKFIGTNTLLAATDDDLFRSTDGGHKTGHWFMLESTWKLIIHPTDPTHYFIA